MDSSPPGFSIRGILQARILEWVAISFSRRSAQLRHWTGVFHNAGRLFTIRRATRKGPPYLFNLLWSLCFVTIFHNYILSPKSTYPYLKLSFPTICSVYPLWELTRQLKPKLYEWIPSKSASLVVLSISVNVKSLFPFAWVKFSDLSLTFLTPHMESIRTTCSLSSKIYLDTQHFCPLLSWAEPAPSAAIDL